MNPRLKQEKVPTTIEIVEKMDNLVKDFRTQIDKLRDLYEDNEESMGETTNERADRTAADAGGA